MTMLDDDDAPPGQAHRYLEDSMGGSHKSVDDGTLRSFESGATRDTADGKLDYEGFLHPWVLEWYAEYMDRNREQSDGSIRPSDNWQKGIPRDVYIKSMFRHFMEIWRIHRTEHTGAFDVNRPARNDALSALMFNVMGYMFEIVAEEMGLREVEGLPETTLHEITESMMLKTKDLVRQEPLAEG